MIFPVVYAVLTWYLAMRWRREWPSYLAVSLSVGVLIMVIRMIRAWEEHIPDVFRLGLVLLYPYTVVLGAVGFFICVLPRRPTETQCRRCRYELTGLNPVGLTCPECGTQWRGRGSEFEDKTKPHPILNRAEFVERSSPDQPPNRTKQQNQ